MSLCWCQENSNIGDVRKGKLSFNRRYLIAPIGQEVEQLHCMSLRVHE